MNELLLSRTLKFVFPGQALSLLLFLFYVVVVVPVGRGPHRALEGLDQREPSSGAVGATAVQEDVVVLAVVLLNGPGERREFRSGLTF